MLSSSGLINSYMQLKIYNESMKILQRIILGLIVGVFIILFNSCHSITENEPLDEQIIHPFFPLKVGYKWYYNSNRETGNAIDTTNYNLIREVTGTKSIDDRKYFMVIEKEIIDQNHDKIIDTLYYSINSDTLFTILPKVGPYEQKVIIKVILSAKLGDSFIRETYFTSRKMKITVTEKAENKIEYYGFMMGAIDSEFKEVYKINTGLYEERSLAWGRGFILIKKEFN